MIKEIKTFIPATQDEAFHKVVKEGDARKAHLLYLPDWHKPLYMIKTEIRMAKIKAIIDHAQI